MARMKPNLRKQEILDIAYRQFLKKGYEKTSIRSIVGEANGEIGMFYHYFSSKEEIFKTVLEQYNEQYICKVNKLINNSVELSFLELIDFYFIDLEKSILEYAEINNGMVNMQMLEKLHKSTLTSLNPVFCNLVQKYIDRGEISPPEIDVNILVDFIIYGISAVIHNNNQKSRKEKYYDIKVLLNKLLSIKINNKVEDGGHV